MESWDAEDDSEEEVEEAKAETERKAKAAAQAAAQKKSHAQRVKQHQEIRKAQQQAEEESEEEETSSEEEDEVDKRQRLRRTEQDADLKHAEDLLSGIGISDKRSAPKTVVVVGGQAQGHPENAVDLSSLELFKANTKADFDQLTRVLSPLLTSNARSPQYSLNFLPELFKQLCKDLPSAEIKKLSSSLATLSNEKMREEKAADKGSKKSKAAKTKATLVANRDTSLKADITAYDDGPDELVRFSFLLLGINKVSMKKILT